MPTNDERFVAIQQKSQSELGLRGLSRSREVLLGPRGAFIREFLLDAVWFIVKFMISTLKSVELDLL